MSMAMAWLIAAAVLFIIALHPFVTYPLSLWLVARLRGALLDKAMNAAAALEPANNHHAAKPLRFAICVCAYNEEKVIAEKVQNLLALQQCMPGTEVWIYVDAASDNTATLLQPYHHHFNVHVATHRHGKTHGMNLLVKQCNADIVVFTDANVRMDLDALSKLQTYFADPRIGCVTSHLTYTNPDDSITAQSGSLYWQLEEFIKSLEQRTGSVMGADGSLFAIRRELHHAPPDHLIDDMYVSLQILCDGYRVVQANDVNAYEKSGTVGAEEFRRKVRIACQAFNVHRTLWPRLKTLGAWTVYQYVSHKLLRWVTIYLLALSALCVELSLLSLQAWLPALTLPLLAGVALGLGQRYQLTPFAQITDLLSSLLGAGLGVWRSLRGEHFQTWRPSNSVRETS